MTGERGPAVCLGRGGGEHWNRINHIKKDNTKNEGYSYLELGVYIEKRKKRKSEDFITTGGRRGYS